VRVATQTRIRGAGRVRAAALAVLAIACLVTACRREDQAPPEPKVPAGSAGEILSRAIDAAGGWQRWLSVRDVTFVSTFVLYDPAGRVTNETIGVHRSPLHTTPRARFESLGLPEPVTIGFDGAETWMLRGGQAVDGGDRLLLARFNMVSDLFWFSMPFNLAEIPATITDLGDEETHEGRWHRLKAVLDDGAPEAPGDWHVLYIDTRTGLIDHIFAHVTAEFLEHRLWVGKWLEYRDWNGLRKERRRQFFPADPEGRIAGPLIAERLVEDVRFNESLSDELFRKPASAKRGQPA